MHVREAPKLRLYVGFPVDDIIETDIQRVNKVRFNTTKAHNIIHGVVYGVRFVMGLSSRMFVTHGTAGANQV